MSVIGIDLGTTNSCVAVWRNDKVEIIANDQGSRTTPSCVSFTEDERYIGEPAALKMLRNPSNTVYDVKRLIGRSFNDPIVHEDVKLWPFTVVDLGGKPGIQVEFRKETKTFTAEELSAMVLGKMKETAETFIGQKVTGAVITVPAYFNNAQRQATIDAGKIAGLNVLRIINEPTAAALAYGHSDRSESDRKILIYDLGGGTFDVSIVAIENGTDITVLASTGDTHLGGCDFDEQLVRFVADKYLEQSGNNIFVNKRSLCKLKKCAREGKQVLSSSMSYDMYMENLVGDCDLDLKITRATFENICDDLFRSTLKHVETAIDEAKLKKDDIDEVVLVGGSTRIPMVQQLLQEFFPGKSVKTTINPDEAVAYGAAVQAAILQGDSTIKFTNIVNDIATMSLGTDVDNGEMDFIIKRNTRLPCNISQNYNTSIDNQTDIEVNIFQGERLMAKDNHLLDSFVLSGIPPAKAGVGSVVVTFAMDANGILRASAVERITGKKMAVVIQMKEKGLSAEEVERMEKDEAKYREQDELDKAIAEHKNVLQRLKQRRREL